MNIANDMLFQYFLILMFSVTCKWLYTLLFHHATSSIKRELNTCLLLFMI